MALTALKSVRLEDAALTDLFNDNEERWLAMATHAYRYTMRFVAETGQQVRPDDLIPVLVPALEVDEKLREHLDRKKLSQQYWFTYFGELIVDRLWNQITEEADDDNEG